MIQDGEQRHDVSEKFPEETSKLSQAVVSWRKEVLKDYRKTKRPFTVGHPDFAITQLPARDAKASGKIKRSNRFPNDSYFTNWTTTEGSIDMGH
jgi:hypothetical protein